MTKMLIDGRHPEETRVVVARGNRIDDFDFESADKKQLKGNIYLARVTRVEPSLQAAFVEYGGNRHGFLAFSEIHPDYYQIPHEDRAALIAEEREAARSAQDEDHDDEAQSDAAADASAGDAPDLEADAESATGDPAASETDEADQIEENSSEESPSAEALDAAPEGSGAETHEPGEPEITEAGASEEAQHEAQRNARRLVKRRYKIQEVIKKRQILLVQVVKEERGGKGAALTTYMSLAGRYCVLMPNTLNGGGISRKISNSGDRKRLKEIMGDLVLPEGMACIIRTAGLKRTKSEIKRDFDYLTRLWDEIREKTLKSVAPALIYEDSSLIKRAIRDIYSREIDEIIIDGEESYRNAREFMKLLMPSHVKRVQLYKDRVPIFHRYQVEAQLETMYHPTVQLKSGGYLVINPTEALVSIDINSGRATREYNIEETATKTNMEAAEEIARQLRLRDMAGLVVIDFIDMEDNRNVRKVEKQLKEALKNDRARIQVGRISQFGLLEMSRQRLRTGVLEASTHTCQHCKGAGFVRSVPSSALYTLRAVEEEMIKGRAAELTVFVAPDVAIYLLNKKRAELQQMEARYGIVLDVQPKPALTAPDVEIERIGTAPALPVTPIEPIALVDEPDADTAAEIEEEEEAEALSDAAPERAARDEGGRRRRRKRRRARDRDHDRDAAETAAAPASEATEASVSGQAETGEAGQGAAEEGDEKTGRRRRRRGRRGGRNRHREETQAVADEASAAESPAEEASDKASGEEASTPQAEEVRPAVSAEPDAGETLPETQDDAAVADSAPKKPTKRSRSRKPKSAAAPDRAEVSPDVAQDVEAAPKQAPVQVQEPELVMAEPAAAMPPVAPASDLPPEGVIIGADSDAAASRPPRKGWWQRTFG